MSEQPSPGTALLPLEKEGSKKGDSKKACLLPYPADLLQLAGHPLLRSQNTKEANDADWSVECMDGPQQSRPSREFETRTCYYCGKAGHLKNQCRRRMREQGGGRPVAAASGSQQ